MELFPAQNQLAAAVSHERGIKGVNVGFKSLQTPQLAGELWEGRAGFITILIVTSCLSGLLVVQVQAGLHHPE